MMKEILRQLVGGGSLDTVQAEGLFETIMRGEADPVQVGAGLAMIAQRTDGATVDELLGAARVMRRHAISISAPADAIDTCSAGGVHSRFFNVSTTAAIVAASCGVPVVKHGNRSITSASGSSDVLGVLGLNLRAAGGENGAGGQAERCLAAANICFAFAPNHHPAMKHVVDIRKSLGFPTIFNLLGPLTNPAGVRQQVVGVGNDRLAVKLMTVLIRLGTTRAIVITGVDEMGGRRDAICDFSVTGPTVAYFYDAATGNEPRMQRFCAEDIGLPVHDRSDGLVIETPGESAARIRAVLGGKSVENGAARDIVLANAATALWVGGRAATLHEGVRIAADALDSGSAAKTLETLIATSWK